MATINTNANALFAQNAMKINERAQTGAMKQLSTGFRINSAADDAAGIAIGQSMTSQIRGLNQAVRNMNDGINMMQTAEGSLTETSNMLQRMRELAVQSANGSYSSEQRSYLDNEFSALKVQVDSIAEDTNWNGIKLLTTDDGRGNSRTFTYQAGIKGEDTIEVDMGVMDMLHLSGGTSAAGSVQVGTAASGTAPSADYKAAVTAAVAESGTRGTSNYQAAIGTSVQVGTEGSSDYAPASADYKAAVDYVAASLGGSLDITTVDAARTTMATLDTAITTVNEQRSKIGAVINQMTYAVDNLSNVSSNIGASRSTIMDTDYASASTQLSKTQIIQQAATAMLAQANQQPQSVLALLK